jgi:hypothetical protein
MRGGERITFVSFVQFVVQERLGGGRRTASAFLDAGWDFVGETENGTEDIWWILEGKDYPRLWWEAHN